MEKTYVLKHPINKKYMDDTGAFTKSVFSKNLMFFTFKEALEEVANCERISEDYQLKGKLVIIKQITLD